MFPSSTQHCAYIVTVNPHDKELSGSVTDNKLPICAPVHQLLGNFEKLAGDLAFYHLQRCESPFSRMRHYGLIIACVSQRSRSYN